MLHVLTSMDPRTGGVCQVIRNSVPAMEEKGLKNEVLCFDPPGASFLAHEKFIVHALGPSKGPYSYCPGLNRWLHENLERFDIIIVHGLWQHHSYGTFNAIHQYSKHHDHKPALFVMPHGMLDPYFQRAKSRKLKAIRNYFFWKLIENRVINNANGLLFTCEQELLLARESFSPYQPKSEINVGYGIAHPPAYKQQFLVDFYLRCPSVKNKPYFLFLSRIHPKKGVELLVKAYLRLEEEFSFLPDLVIAGPGIETAYGEILLKLCAGKRIHFPGMLMDNAKWGAFYGCETFVLPSHQENFGIAVVEALACKKAVLVSNQVNIFREIEKGQAGMVADDSESGIYKILKNWLHLSQEEKQIMEGNAYETYINHYIIEQAAIEFIGALKRALVSLKETKKLHHGIITHNL